LRPNQHVDGMNLQPVLASGASLGRTALFWHNPHYNLQHPHTAPSSVIRQGPWKLIETFDPEGVELYNLAEDLGETRNLAPEKIARTAELRRELAAWRQTVGAEMMQPNPDYDPTAKPPATAKKKPRTR